MLPPRLGKPRIYPPVGRCIYCAPESNPNVKLGDEHIIPEGLGGTWILREASCKKHEGITTRFEGYVLRHLLIAPRIHLKLPTKRPKERPTTLPVTLVDNDGNSVTIQTPADNRPIPLFLIHYVYPGILLGLKPDTIPPHGPPPFNIWGVIWWPKPGMSNAGYYGSRDHSVPFVVEWGRFCRMIAKIGHSFACAEIGVNNFNPLLLDLIHSDLPESASYLIGGSVGREKEGEDLHELSIETHTIQLITYYVVRIRLFSYLGAPVYYAVAGTKRR